MEESQHLRNKDQNTRRRHQASRVFRLSLSRIPRVGIFPYNHQQARNPPIPTGVICVCPPSRIRLVSRPRDTLRRSDLSRPGHAHSMARPRYVSAYFAYRRHRRHMGKLPLEFRHIAYRSGNGRVHTNHLFRAEARGGNKVNRSHPDTFFVEILRPLYPM